MTPSAMSTPLHKLPLGHTLRYSVYTVPKSSQAVQEQGSTHPVSSPVTLQERKQQFVRDAIWDAAIDLFDRKGFDETTVEEIAQAAGTSRRSFFRYFESKSDLLAQAVVSYGTSLTDAIESCPAEYSLGDVFRSTVLRVARDSAAQPRTRKVMEIAERYPAAREAQIARVAEVQDRVAKAFARRCRKNQEGELEAQVLAGLTLSMLSATYFSWFRRGTHDIAITAEQVFATLTHIVCRAGTADKQRSASTGSVRRKP
jgi:AcrR family transcriptional regulator